MIKLHVDKIAKAAAKMIKQDAQALEELRVTWSLRSITQVIESNCWSILGQLSDYPFMRASMFINSAERTNFF